MNNLEETIELFRDIVSTMDVKDIPPRYISAISFFDSNGFETVVDGTDVERLINRSYPYENIDRKEISVMLDIRTLAVDAMLELTDLLTTLDKRMKGK